MSPSLLEALDGAEHEQVQVLRDPSTRMLAFVAIHRTVEGPAFGGVRRFGYRNGAEALADVLRLSRAMTYKCAMAGVRGGGGKTVIVDHDKLDVRAAYGLIGRYVENMHGRYYTGPDIGTGPKELGWLASSTDFVTRPGPDGPGDLAQATARGVLAGLRAVVRALARTHDHLPEDPERQGYEGVRFVIQGLGSVGSRIAQQLTASGATVLATEIDAATRERVRSEIPLEIVPHERGYEVPCDVFVPCAMGGILHDVTVKRLACLAIAGSANNILASDQHAVELANRGVLVAPDYVINSGALILGANFHLTGNREQTEAIDRIEPELDMLFERSRNEAVAPCVLADRIAEERLAASRGPAYFPESNDRT